MTFNHLSGHISLTSQEQQLPVNQMREQIRQAIQKHQVVIVCGETGSGKTTQLPQICLELGRAAQGKMIAHTQPRRLAATSVAKRIAQELKTEIGSKVGYQIRFNDKSSHYTQIKLMTDGILLSQIQHDPYLKQYDTIIIDEAHERSLNIDFLLGFLKPLLRKRPDLKLIVTSATIDAERFAQHFIDKQGRPAPILEVSGRMYPVEIRYRPILQDLDDKQERSSAIQERDLMSAIADAVDECMAEGSGDILVFLPGEREIRETQELLRKHPLHGAEVLPLFARMSQQDQERIFRPTSNLRRIVLATNVAETSLTVPGIRFVIDSGLARIKRYSLRHKVEQLRIEAISQASANQRSGRCGRIGAGICIRLYDEADFFKRPAFTDPEILRSSLSSVILRLLDLGVRDLEAFPFLQAPSHRAFVDGFTQLQELNAIDEHKRLTSLGRQMAKLPLDPKVARMILAAKDHHCLREILIITSALSVQDPRERPLEAREQSQQAHAKFKDDKSEFLSYLKLWNWYHEAVKHKTSQRQLRQQLKTAFLSWLRMREWHDVHHQLSSLLAERGWRINTSDASYEQIHVSLMSGLLSCLGLKNEEGSPSQSVSSYQGARGLRFMIHPSSSMQKKAGKWVMAAELVETTRLYARCVANIDVKWVEKVASHLLHKQYSEPQWYPKQGQVLVNERASLYGLPIYHARKRQPIDLEEAHDVFIREALVADNIDTQLPFLKQNRRLLERIEQLEHRSRRQDILVDDELMVAFYKAHIPVGIHKTVDLEQWYRHCDKLEQDALLMKKEDFMRHEASGVTTQAFPKQMSFDAGLVLKLDYHFEPGSPKDGVTLTVPVYALNQVDTVRCTWLVPGMLKEKVTLLLKTLPQKLRKHFVPLNEYAAGFCERHDVLPMGVDLVQALVKDAFEQLRLTLNPRDFHEESLPLHMLMNFKVVDEHGRMLSSGRQLGMLRATHGQLAQVSFQKLVQDKTESIPVQEVITSWSFGEMPEILELQKGKQKVIGYAALLDEGTHCQMDVFDDLEVATQTHQKGLLRLFMLNLKDQIKGLSKQMPDAVKLGMLYMDLGSIDELKEDLMQTALRQLALQQPWPRDEASFLQRLSEVKERLGLLWQELSRQTMAILTQWQAVKKKLKSFKAFSDSYEDIQTQLEMLMSKHFLLDTPFEQLPHLLRYLKAIDLRLDKLSKDPQRDAKLMKEFQPLWQLYLRKKQSLKGRYDPKLEQFFYLLQELRVMLFAQELKTPMPVSVKRLEKAWHALGLSST